MSIPYEPSVRQIFNGGGVSSMDLVPRLGLEEGFKNSLIEDSTRKLQFTRFMRGQEITFISKGLCPDKTANVFFDKTDVKKFTQKANKITVSSLSLIHI